MKSDEGASTLGEDDTAGGAAIGAVTIEEILDTGAEDAVDIAVYYPRTRYHSAGERERENSSYQLAACGVCG